MFSDVKANAIYRWDRRDGARLFMRSSGYTGPEPAPTEEPDANGLAFDGEGRLLICEHDDRRITRLEADGRKTVLADRWQGRRPNSPNDLVCRGNGDALSLSSMGARYSVRLNAHVSGCSAESSTVRIARELRFNARRDKVRPRGQPVCVRERSRASLAVRSL